MDWERDCSVVKSTTALIEDPDLVLSTHVVATITCDSNFDELDTLSWLCGQQVYMCVGKACVSKIKINKSNKLY